MHVGHLEKEFYYAFYYSFLHKLWAAVPESSLSGTNNHDTVIIFSYYHMISIWQIAVVQVEKCFMICSHQKIINFMVVMASHPPQSLFSEHAPLLDSLLNTTENIKPSTLSHRVIGLLFICAKKLNCSYFTFIQQIFSLSVLNFKSAIT